MARSNLNKCLHFASFNRSLLLLCTFRHMMVLQSKFIIRVAQQIFLTQLHIEHFSHVPLWSICNISFVNSLSISSFNKGLVNTKFHINLPNSFYWKLAILLHKYLPLQCGTKSWVNISANSLHNAQTFLLYTITPSYIANNNWEASLQRQGSLQLLMVPLSLCYCALFVVSFL